MHNPHFYDCSPNIFIDVKFIFIGPKSKTMFFASFVKQFRELFEFTKQSLLNLLSKRRQHLFWILCWRCIGRYLDPGHDIDHTQGNVIFQSPKGVCALQKTLEMGARLLLRNRNENKIIQRWLFELRII